jgi:hypothetical protein
MLDADDPANSNSLEANDLMQVDSDVSDKESVLPDCPFISYEESHIEYLSNNNTTVTGGIELLANPVVPVADADPPKGLMNLGNAKR